MGRHWLALLPLCLLLAAAAPESGRCADGSYHAPPALLQQSPVSRVLHPGAGVAGDELWRDGFGAPVTDGYVSCAIDYQGAVVIAGGFSRVGDMPANNIARWDGTTWSPLGSGIEWGSVQCLAIHDGDLIVGGWFQFAGGVPARSIARWDGVAWSAFGAGIHDEMSNPVEVWSVASYGGTLVAASESRRSDYRWGSRLASWNGSEWGDLGVEANGRVTSLAVQDGALFAGGGFDSIAGAPAAALARWDGSSWTEVGGGLGLPWTSPPWVLSLAVHDGRLIVAGFFDAAGGLPVMNIAAWSGTAWEPMGSGILWPVAALTVKQDTLFAGCQDGVARWNGQDWDFPSPGLRGTPSGLAPLGEDLVVVGEIEATNPVSDVPVALSVARLSSGGWHALLGFTDRMRGLADAGGSPAWVSSVVPYRDRLLVGGRFEFAGAPPAWARVTNLAEWDGAAWTQFPLPPGIDGVFQLLAAGDTLAATATNGPNPVFLYDGSHWTALVDSTFSVVTAIALHRGGLFAGGIRYGAGTEARVARWNGTAWDVIGVARLGQPGMPLITALVGHDDMLVAAGRFATMDNVPTANIASWDGGAWHQPGPGFPAPAYDTDAMVRSLAVAGGRLLASGEAVAASFAASSVAQWSGTAWEPRGSYVGSVNRLEVAGGELFACGDLRAVSGPRRSQFLLRWSGSDWGTMGSGTNGPVFAFAAFGDAIYAGGAFSEAGGNPSFAIARWNPAQQTPAAPSFLAPRPNPFRSTASFPYTLSAAGRVTIRVHDVHGREIAVIEQRDLAPGVYTATWDGRDRTGREAPSGVYFIRAELPGGAAQTRKAVLLR